MKKKKELAHEIKVRKKKEKKNLARGLCVSASWHMWCRELHTSCKRSRTKAAKRGVGKDSLEII